MENTTVRIIYAVIPPETLWVSTIVGTTPYASTLDTIKSIIIGLELIGTSYLM